MIVQFSSEADPTVVDGADFGSLSVTAAGPIGKVRFDPLGRLDDDGQHVWLDIAALRSALPVEARARIADYDGMIAYATRKGWVDEAGISVRAHITSPT